MFDSISDFDENRFNQLIWRPNISMRCGGILYDELSLLSSSISAMNWSIHPTCRTPLAKINLGVTYDPELRWVASYSHIAPASRCHNIKAIGSSRFTAGKSARDFPSHAALTRTAPAPHVARYHDLFLFVFWFFYVYSQDVPHKHPNSCSCSLYGMFPYFLSISWLIFKSSDFVYVILFLFIRCRCILTPMMCILPNFPMRRL